MSKRQKVEPKEKSDAVVRLEEAVNNLKNDEGTDEDHQIALSMFGDCFKDAIIKIIPYFDEYKDVKDLEVEFRLGFIEESSFSTDVSEEFYQKIFQILDKSSCWTKKDSTTTEDYFSNGKRKSVNLVTKKEIIIKKEKLIVLDFSFQGTPFDLRVSFSREIPKKTFSEKNINYKRQKKRKSYIHQYWNYDLTVVTTDENTVLEKTYEVELEISTPLREILGKIEPYFFVHSSLLKIKDLVNMCEEDEGSSKLCFVREKK
jgi:hypothetical protein